MVRCPHKFRFRTLPQLMNNMVINMRSDQKRALGENCMSVAPVGVGAMSFSNFYGTCDDQMAEAVLKRCLELGINHIDTSNVYGDGKSEERIGAFLRKQGKQAADFFHIATKAGIARKPGTNERVFNNQESYLEEQLDLSLKRMGIEQVDLFYVHRRQAEIPIEEVTGTLVRLIDKGKIKSFGFSEIAPSSLRRAHAVHPVAAVQSEYSLSTRAPELGLIQACSALGTALVAFSPVGRTYLTDRPRPHAEMMELPFMKVNPRFQQPNYDANMVYVQALQALAADMGVATASLAIAWVLAQAPHIIAIPGTRKPNHLDELAAAMQIEITAEIEQAIEKIMPVGWAHGDRYSAQQWVGPERYC